MSLIDSLGILHMENDDARSNVKYLKPTVTKVACLRCRALKRKCDGLHPICGPCFKKGSNKPCVYSSPNSALVGSRSSKKGSNQPRVSSLQSSAPVVENQSTETSSRPPCSTCRAKKVRCDREIPVCGACVKRGIAQNCSYIELPKTQQLGGKAKTVEGRPSRLTRRTSTSFPTTFNGENCNKKPRLSSPAGLQDSMRHAGLEYRVFSPMPSSWSSLSSIDDSSDVLRAEADDNNPMTYGLPIMEPIQIPTSHAHRRRSSQQLSQIPVSSRNQRPHNTAQSSVRLLKPSKSKAITRTHSNGVSDADATTSEEFSTKLQQIISVRTDSTKPTLKYQSQQENRRRSYNGKRIPGSTDVDPQSLGFDLPSRELADRLVQSYMKWENANLPVFDIHNFQLMYENFWGRNIFSGDPHIFYAMLNTVFALGCFIIGRPRRGDASVFYDRARSILDSGVSDDETVSHVQAYLLASRYLYAIGSLGPAWSKISLAISLAQSLGLHLSSGSQTLKCREDRELVRKVWHNCLVTQRKIAMTKGLSTVTSSPFAPFPTPLKSEYIDLELGGRQSSVTDRPSIIEFFNGMAKLYGQFEDLSTFQAELRSMGIGASEGKLKSIGLQPFFNLDRFLSDWKESLPSFLQPGNTHPALKNPIVLRHHNILQIQYLHTHLQLRRHFFSIVVTSGEHSLFSPSIELSDSQVRSRYSTDAPLSITIIRDSALRCVVLAREILDIIHQYRDYENVKQDEPELIPSWWDNIGYIYACSTILIASQTSPLIRAELSADYIEESWQVGIKLLESYLRYSDSVEKCLSALKIMAGVTGGDVGNGEAGGSDIRGNMSEQVSNGQVQAWLESLPADLED